MMARKTPEDVSKDSLRQKIEDDTEAFLAAGGEITVIPSGQSGVDMTKPGQKQIKLGNTQKS